MAGLLVGGPPAGCGKAERTSNATPISPAIKTLHMTLPFPQMPSDATTTSWVVVLCQHGCKLRTHDTR